MDSMWLDLWGNGSGNNLQGSASPLPCGNKNPAE
jgi:hypothetical protein